jgi:hypothetical protein
MGGMRPSEVMFVFLSSVSATGSGLILLTAFFFPHLLLNERNWFSFRLLEIVPCSSLSHFVFLPGFMDVYRRIGRPTSVLDC